jgi:DNA-binding response OmpR family regulator
VTRRVLVVEDEHRLAALLQENLTAQGFEVLLAHDGEKGLEVARAQHPELVISDVLLPKLTGWELCRKLKADPDLRGIRVLLMTAVYTKARYRTDATEAGADDFVTKPLNLDDLAARMARLLPATPSPLWPRPGAGSTAPGQQHPVSRPVVLQAAAQPAVAATAATAQQAASSDGASGQAPAATPTPVQLTPNERLALMRRHFAASLPRTLGHMERTWANAAGGSGREAWEELARLAHDLAGSAGSFGLPEVGDAAGALEQIIRTELASGTPLAEQARLAVKQAVEHVSAVAQRL